MANIELPKDAEGREITLDNLTCQYSADDDYGTVPEVRGMRREATACGYRMPELREVRTGRGRR